MPRGLDLPYEGAPLLELWTRMGALDKFVNWSKYQIFDFIEGLSMMCAKGITSKNVDIMF